MCWRKREMWKAGIAIIGMLLVLVVWVPVSTADAHERASGLVGPGTATVQTTLTVDATVSVLSKEQLSQQIKQLQLQNDRSIAAWFWNVGTTLGTIVAALIAVVGVFATVRFNSQKELNDRQAERDKRAEERLKERFEELSSIVTGLGDEKEEAKIGAAILLSTFLRPGYEGFYTQIFQLVAANLRLPRTSTPPEDLAAPLPLTALSQALMIAFMEAFPLAQEQVKKTMGTKLADNEDKVRSTHPAPVTISSTEIRSLNALGILLDNGFLWYADLKQAWMPQASLRKTDLTGADLSGANLYAANLSEAYLWGTNLRGANLWQATLCKADLRGTDLSGATLLEANLSEARLYYDVDLRGADLSRADLSGADLSEVKNLEDVLSLKKTILRRVKGLTKEQLEACKAKGAIIDEDAIVSSSLSPIATPSSSPNNDAQTPSAPSAQVNTPIPDTDGSSTTSSKLGPEREVG